MTKKTNETNNEVMVLNTDKAEKLVAKFLNAVNKVNASAWEVAKVAYETVNAKDFKQTFGTLENYANSVGYSKSNISKLVKAYSSKIFLTDATGGQICDFTTSQIMEMNPIEDIDKIEFIEAYNITEDTTVKEIRENVKAWKEVENALEVEATEVEATEAEETAEEVIDENMDDVMCITYKGDIWQIFSEKDIKKIIDIITA